ncbi:MAG: ribose 5-phosphate isomerase B [Cyclobacteriaceae bacterium]|nr:ribose 5-phosphate isomerase B [Cyclobacteriaceae bacterium]MCH8515626.1 ribose 5-phosphate isomerase B [Cyclobacteriaceae bacterium]
MKKVVIAGDHAGYQLKEKVKQQFSQQYEFQDMGPHSEDSVDYPDFAHALAEELAKDKEAMGILICGSGNGVAITANKHEHIRAALCWNEELAALARQHNNANVICLPARFVSEVSALAITDAFFKASFEGGRHEKRVNKISC